MACTESSPPLQRRRNSTTRRRSQRTTPRRARRNGCTTRPSRGRCLLRLRLTRGDTDCWISFEDKTDPTLVLVLTSGRIELNSEPRLVSTGPLCGEHSLVWKLKCDVCGQFVCTCSCVFPLCCLSWYAHQMCRHSHKLLAEIDLLEYLHRESVFFFFFRCFYFMTSQCRQLWSSVEVCVAKLMRSLCCWCGGGFSRKKKQKNLGIVRFKILALCNILIYDYIFALNAH